MSLEQIPPVPVKVPMVGKNEMVSSVWNAWFRNIRTGFASLQVFTVGSPGLVPAPTASDVMEGRTLGADGTWKLGPRSEVVVITGGGRGSANTAIRIFNTVAKNTGTAITRASSATDGDSFTTNEDGVYSVSYSDSAPLARAIGISVNASLLTTTVISIAYADGLRAIATSGNANFGVQVSWTGFLSAGSVVRPHVELVTYNSATGQQIFSIVQVSK